MKFASFMVVGPGEGDRWLEQSLKQLWVDNICICLNNADQKTRDIAKKYAHLLVEDNREWGKEQWRIKQDFLTKIIEQIKPDWVWTLDCDEIFDSKFTRQEAERLASGKDVAFYFWCLQLWNQDDMVRVDLSFPNIRFYKIVPDLGLYFQATALHCGLAPRYAYQLGSQSQFYFKHYGLMKFEDRKRKVERYAKYDPQEKYKGHSWYGALKNESINPKPIAQVIADLPGEILKRKDVKIMNKKDKQIFWFRNKFGRPVPAEGQKTRDQYLKAGMQELKELEVNPNPEAPVIAAPKTETEYVQNQGPQTEYTTVPKDSDPVGDEPSRFECEHCEKSYASKQGLKTHTKNTHGQG